MITVRVTETTADVRHPQRGYVYRREDTQICYLGVSMPDVKEGCVLLVNISDPHVTNALWSSGGNFEPSDWEYLGPLREVVV